MRVAAHATLLLALLGLLGGLAGGHAATAQSDSQVKSYTNGYLTIHALIGSNEGLSYVYTVSTGERHPAPGKNVLYGGSDADPWSSYITILVADEGVAYVNSFDFQQANDSSGRVYEVRPMDNYTIAATELANGFVVTWDLDNGIRVTQTVIVAGDALDTSMIVHQVTVENYGSSSHTVGVRYLWDIMIADEDGAFLRLWRDSQPVTEWLTTEYVIDSPQPGMIWQTTDNPENATFTIWGGITLPQGVTPPDEVIYGYWGGLYDNAWYYRANTSKVIAEDDVAVAYYWMPRTLEPGQQLKIVEALLPVTTGASTVEEPPKAAESTIPQDNTTQQEQAQQEQPEQQTQQEQPETAPAQEQPQEQAPAQQQEPESPAESMEQCYCLSMIQILVVFVVGLLLGALIARR